MWLTPEPASTLGASAPASTLTRLRRPRWRVVAQRPEKWACGTAPPQALELGEMLYSVWQVCTEEPLPQREGAQPLPWKWSRVSGRSVALRRAQGPDSCACHQLCLWAHASAGTPGVSTHSLMRDFDGTVVCVPWCLDCGVGVRSGPSGESAFPAAQRLRAGERAAPDVSTPSGRGHRQACSRGISAAGEV